MPTMIRRRLLVHQDGPALWPDHKPLAEVLDLRSTTPPHIFETTYQGHATQPAGSLFKRDWWRGRKNRYDPGEAALRNFVARWISWDTAHKEGEENDFSAGVVGELWPDYRLAIRHIHKQQLEFPDLPDQMTALARQFNYDDKLRGIIIEDAASGTSAYQTLAKSSEAWLAPLIIPFRPTGSKTERAQQAAVWCRNDCVLFPLAGVTVPWLLDFEDELFLFPGVTHDDQVDAFTQLIIYCENIIAEGWRQRNGVDDY